MGAEQNACITLRRNRGSGVWSCQFSAVHWETGDFASRIILVVVISRENWQQEEGLGKSEFVISKLRSDPFCESLNNKLPLLRAAACAVMCSLLAVMLKVEQSLCPHQADRLHRWSKRASEESPCH
jgi:hypothetical protein